MRTAKQCRRFNRNAGNYRGRDNGWAMGIRRIPIKSLYVTRGENATFIVLIIKLLKECLPQYDRIN